MIDKIKYAVGITAYNPDVKMIRNMIGYADIFDVVLIYDNSNKSAIKDYVNDKANVIVFSNGRNMGLPYAYNLYLKKAQELGCQYLCLLDQDSSFDQKNIFAIQEMIKSQTKSLDRVAIISPYIDYGNANKRPSETILEQEWVITSGSFLNVNLIFKSGLRYDVNYFIDRCEVDFCKQLRAKGYKILMYTKSVLYQQLGEDNGKKHSNHSPLRHYYIFRNRLYFNKKFYGIPQRWALNVLQSCKHILLILLNEENKIKKIRFFKKAINDYRNDLMGEYQDK